MMYECIAIRRTRPRCVLLKEEVHSIHKWVGHRHILCVSEIVENEQC